MATRIIPEVADVLGRATIRDKVVQLPAGQLARPLYAAVDNALKLLGGKWDRRAGGHVFPFDPSLKLAEALGAGTVIGRQQRLQLFETPVPLAERLVAMLDVRPDDTCLEPSAGRGRLVNALAAHTPDHIRAVEIDADNCRELEQMDVSIDVVCGDFLTFSPETLRCDVVVMNPPFTRNQDIKHVRHAFDCLKPGGRLAAIVSCHGFLGQEREAAEWRTWLDALDAEVEPIPAGAFKESGTSVETRIIRLIKGEG